MKDYKVIKIDRRYNGYRYFKYIVEPKYQRGDAVWIYTTSRVEFQAWREWCRTTFGEGMERDWACGLIHSNKIPPQSWAWDTEHGNKRLYLNSDTELTLFKLRF